MAARGREQKPKNLSTPSHPKANLVIVATIAGEEYRAYVTHIEYIYDDFLGRVKAPWQLKFHYLISKKREKGLIAGWERNPHDPFKIEILPVNPNKYQRHATYRGLAKFNVVEEHTDVVPIQAHFVLDIVTRSSIIGDATDGRVEAIAQVADR